MDAPSSIESDFVADGRPENLLRLIRNNMRASLKINSLTIGAEGIYRRDLGVVSRLFGADHVTTVPYFQFRQHH